MCVTLVPAAQTFGPFAENAGNVGLVYGEIEFLGQFLCDFLMVYVRTSSLDRYTTLA